MYLTIQSHLCTHAKHFTVSLNTTSFGFTTKFTQINYSLHSRGRSAADAVMLQGYAQKYLTQIVALLGCVPSDLLLLFKTSDCLRHLDHMLGASVNTSAGETSVGGVSSQWYC